MHEAAGPGSDPSDPGRPRILFVSELTAFREGDRVLVPEGHLRRYGDFSSHFDMTWSLTPRPAPGFQRAVLPDGIDVVWLPGFASVREWVRSLPRLVSILWRAVPDHDALLVNVPSFAALPALVVARLRGRPAPALQLSRWVQLRRHPERSSAGGRLLMALLTQLAVLLASRTYVVGTSLPREIWRPLRRRISTIEYPAIDDDDVLPLGERPASADEPPLVLLSVGRFIATKRLDAVVLTVDELLRRGHDVRAILVGDGVARPDVEALIEATGLEQHVDLVGWIDDWGQLRQRYLDAFAFVFASEDEGLPLVVMEAMALGLPVVSTPAGGLATWLSDGRDCLMVAQPDPVRLADAIEQLVEDPELRRRLQEAAREKVRSNTRERWLEWFVAEVRALLRHR